MKGRKVRVKEAWRKMEEEESTLEGRWKTGRKGILRGGER